MSSLPLAPHTTPLQSHSPSHSSQASSSVSGATADPLVPSASPFLQQQQHLQQHHHHPHPQQQLHQFPHPQHISQAAALQHHQHMQQQFMAGRKSPALHYSQMTYCPVSPNEHSALPKPDCAASTPTVTSPQTNRPLGNHQPPQEVAQSPGYIEVDEE